MEKGSLKSYIIFVFLCLITFILLFLFVNTIKRSDIRKQSVFDGFIPEIGEKDIVLNLKSYAVDNSNFILYISESNNEIFNKQFKTYLTENSLSFPIIYVDISRINKNIINELKEEFVVDNSNIMSDDVFMQENLFLFTNSKVKSALYIKEHKDINIVDVDNYFNSLGDVIND